MITQFLIQYGYQAVLTGFVVFVLIKFFLPGYLIEKGKNLATKEDIGDITKIVEDIKAGNSVLLEELKSKHQLKLAAIDRRLEVHQEAFTLWLELVRNVHSKGIGSIVIKCQEWWGKNCLYLESSAREAFSKAYHSAQSHSVFLQDKNNKLIEENFARIMDAGQIILEAVKLPHLTETELKDINKANEQQ